MIKVQIFPFNPVQVNTYVLWDSETKECILIDPGCSTKGEEQILVSFVEKQQLNVVRIILTHAHFDHAMGINFALGKWNVPLTGHEKTNLLIEKIPEMAGWFNIHMHPVSLLTDYVKEGDVVPLGKSILEVIHVPGHSPGSIVLYSEKQDFMIAADVLFKGNIGHTEVPYGNLKTLVDGIKNKLMTKPEATIIYTGHGPSTSVAYERANNPYLL